MIFDVLIYWAHRLSHEVPLLWRFHALHHSIEHMDWISAFRNHPIDGFILGPPVVFLLAAGFPLETTGALAVLQAVIGIFVHANVRWRLKPIQRLITPEFHHWHHANDAEAIISNYSGLSAGLGSDLGNLVHASRPAPHDVWHRRVRAADDDRTARSPISRAAPVGQMLSTFSVW